MASKFGWFIDALEPRAGLAFASFRRDDLFSASKSASPLDGPAYFISPPSFMPEAVTSRAVGLQASRQTYNAGFLIDGKEFRFNSLSEVSELVRRVYLRGGGGDGANGGGGGGRIPPVPGGEPIEPVEPPGRAGEVPETAAIATLSAFIGSFRRTDGPGDTQQLQRPQIGDHEAKHSSGFRVSGAAELVTDGALILFSELLSRLPQRRGSEESLVWHESADRFAALISLVGLWPNLASTDVGEQILSHLKARLHVPERDLILERLSHWPPSGRLAMLLYAGVDWERWHRQLDWIGYPRLWCTLAGRQLAQDSISHLRSIPCPTKLHSLCTSLPEAAEQLSAFDALLALTSSPGSILPALQRDAISVLSFCGTAIVGASLHSQELSGFDLVFGVDYPDALEKERSQKIASLGLVWLTQQLPSFHYPSKVEGAIASTSDLVFSPKN